MLCNAPPGTSPAKTGTVCAGEVPGGFCGRATVSPARTETFVMRGSALFAAFAASKGDLDAFWAARKMRTQPGAGKTARKK